jgi:hypothetical protein
MEENVGVEQRMLTLDIDLWSSPDHWRATQKSNLPSWENIELSLLHRFIPPSQVSQENRDQKMKTPVLTLDRYGGYSYPKEHVAHCFIVWTTVQLPWGFWVHHFVHSLRPIPTAWYIHEETWRQTHCWDVLQCQFCTDFSFTGKSPKLTLALQQIKIFLSTDKFTPSYPHVFFSMPKHLLYSIVHPSIDPKNCAFAPLPIYCSKVDTTPYLEDLRHLSFK